MRNTHVSSICSHYFHMCVYICMYGVYTTYMYVYVYMCIYVVYILHIYIHYVVYILHTHIICVCETKNILPKSDKGNVRGTLLKEH